MSFRDSGLALYCEFVHDTRGRRVSCCTFTPHQQPLQRHLWVLDGVWPYRWRDNYWAIPFDYAGCKRIDDLCDARIRAGKAVSGRGHTSMLSLSTDPYIKYDNVFPKRLCRRRIHFVPTSTRVRRVLAGLSPRLSFGQRPTKTPGP